MLFNSISFVIFFPLVTMGFFLLPHRYCWFWLLIASCAFYMAFVPVYILILGGTILVDYFAGIWIEKSEGKKRKRFLILSLVANIGVLAFFKYWNFLNENLTDLLGLFKAGNPIPNLEILLPIGLSFHTFQAMSYTIEVYRGNQKAEKHFGLYALYVMFYPQLVAGPIERPQNILHQFREKKTFDAQKVAEGLQLMLWGIFKKVVIADRLGIYVNQVYSHADSYHGAAVFLAIFFFAMQIYCDFSGYSNIAIGAARVMGFDLVTNFNLPYLSKSVTEYWRRWHMSLTTWFNDYLYTPFVLNRRDWGMAAVVLGLLLTFFISGLWHGAAWTFICFGLMHGLAVVYELLTKKWRKNLSKKVPAWIYNRISVLLTFSFVAFSLIIFRARTFETALTIIHHLGFSRNSLAQLTQPFGTGDLHSNTVELLVSFLMLFILYAVQYFEKQKSLTEQTASLKRPVRWGIYYAFLLLIIFFGVFANRQDFIYFQF